MTILATPNSYPAATKAVEIQAFADCFNEFDTTFHQVLPGVTLLCAAAKTDHDIDVAMNVEKDARMSISIPIQAPVVELMNEEVQSCNQLRANDVVVFWYSMAKSIRVRMRPSEIKLVRFYLDTDFAQTVMGFNPLQSLYSSNLSQKIISSQLSFAMTPSILRSAEKLYKLAKTSGDNPTLISSESMFVMSLIFKELLLAGSTKNNSNCSSVTLKRHVDKAVQAKEILLKDICNPPPLNKLARQVGLNATTLGIIFREYYGCTVYAFLKTIRLKTAKHLLSEGQYSVTKVANMVGYDWQSSFSRNFKEQYGISPTDFAKIKTLSDDSIEDDLTEIEQIQIVNKKKLN